MPEKITPQPENKNKSNELNLDQIPELEKGKNNIYYVKIPRIYSKEEFTKFYVRKMEIESIAQKREPQPKHIKEYKKIDQEIDRMKRKNQEAWQSQLEDLIIKAHNGELGEGYIFDVFYESTSGKSAILAKRQKKLIPLGPKGCSLFNSRQRIPGNRIITPYDTDLIKKLKNMDIDTIEASGYFIGVH